MTNHPACGVCALVASSPPLLETPHWQVHAAEPAGVPGWMLLVSRRHVAGPAHFDDDEARTFGPTLRHCERVLEQVTGAVRIYTAALGESHPHFHGHMVPRYATMPRDARGWGVFDLQRAAAAGEIAPDPVAIARVAAAYARALADLPAPT